jgi:septal ring-binding cell division protein DamX
MLRRVLLPIVAVIFLSACSSNQPPPKYNAQGDYIGWHCTANSEKPSDWRCEKKTSVVTDAKGTADTDKDNAALATDVSGDIAKATDYRDTPDKAFSQKSEAAAIGAHGYQLQLGAYIKQADAVAAAQQIIIAGNINIVPLWSNQKEFFVLLYGHYKSRAVAEQAVLSLKQENPALSYWIRSAASIAKARNQK